MTLIHTLLTLKPISLFWPLSLTWNSHFEQKKKKRERKRQRMEIACKWLLLAYGSHSAIHIQWFHFQVQKLRPREGLDLPKISIENLWQCHRPEIHLYQKLTRYVERKKKKKRKFVSELEPGLPRSKPRRKSLKTTAVELMPVLLGPHC